MRCVDLRGATAQFDLQPLLPVRWPTSLCGGAFNSLMKMSMAPHAAATTGAADDKTSKLPADSR